MTNREPIDIVESDPFDPEVIRRAEELTEKASVEQDDVIAAYIRRRTVAYRRVFNSEDADVQFVLRDLAAFCRAYESTFNPSDKIQHMLEGRREVFYRVKAYTALDHDALYLKLTNAKLKGQED